MIKELDRTPLHEHDVYTVCGGNVGFLGAAYRGLYETPSIRELSEVLSLNETLMFAAHTWLLRSETKDFRETVYPATGSLNRLFEKIASLPVPSHPFLVRGGPFETEQDWYNDVLSYHRNHDVRQMHSSEELLELYDPFAEDTLENRLATVPTHILSALVTELLKPAKRHELHTDKSIEKARGSNRYVVMRFMPKGVPGNRDIARGYAAKIKEQLVSYHAREQFPLSWLKPEVAKRGKEPFKAKEQIATLEPDPCKVFNSSLVDFEPETGTELYYLLRDVPTGYREMDVEEDFGEMFLAEPAPYEHTLIELEPGKEPSPALPEDAFLLSLGSEIVKYSKKIEPEVAEPEPERPAPQVCKKLRGLPLFESVSKNGE